MRPRFSHASVRSPTCERVGAAIAASGLPVVILGRGSNVLVADAGFAGIVVSATALTDRFEIDVERAVVRAGSSVPLPVLARQCAARGLTGFEWAVGVPGSVGGAVRMNAGGHGSDIAASLVEVTVADLLGQHPGRPEVRAAVRPRPALPGQRPRRPACSSSTPCCNWPTG